MKFIYLLFVLFLLTSNTSFAKEIKACGVQWPPFTYAENSKIKRGISYDIYTEAFKRIGIKFTADILPWKRCLKYVEHGKYDAVLDNGIEGPFLPSRVPISAYPLAIYVRQDFPLNRFSWDAINGKHVGMVLGYEYTPKVIGQKYWNNHYASSDAKLVAMLNKKRFDYVLLDIFSATEIAKEQGVELKRLEPLVDLAHAYLVFNLNHGKLAEQFDASLNAMIKDGSIDEIYQRYSKWTYRQMMEISM